MNDIETGIFEVADTPMAVVDRLYEREPDAQPWRFGISNSHYGKTTRLLLKHERRVSLVIIQIFIHIMYVWKLNGI